MLSKEETMDELFKACAIKSKEFKNINAEDIWKYVTVAKKEKTNKLHRFVSAIFSVTVEELIAWKGEEK